MGVPAFLRKVQWDLFLAAAAALVLLLLWVAK
jgi:hypothetical protein